MRTDKTGTLFHPNFGPLTMAEGVLCSNQWTNVYGQRYGTFYDSQGLYLALPLSEVKVYV